MYKPSENDMARARTRAYAAGIRVVARGTRRADAAPVLFTTSSEGAARLHAVAATRTALECDCKAAQNGRYCMHRAVAHDFLVAERAVAKRKADARHEREAAAARMAAVRETAPLARDNRAFSLFK
jgi:hypothetical protein